MKTKDKQTTDTAERDFISGAMARREAKRRRQIRAWAFGGVVGCLMVHIDQLKRLEELFSRLTSEQWTAADVGLEQIALTGYRLVEMARRYQRI